MRNPRGGILRLNQFFACLLAGVMTLPAQQATGPANQLVDVKETLKIAVVEGEGAKNNVRTRTATAPVVEVKDEADKPVAGAEVVFQLPMVGPSGVFNGWLNTQTVRTDEQGRASATGFTPNSEPGRFNIKVTATSGTQKGTAVIAQSNVESATGSSVSAKKSGLWKWVALAGTAAALGGIAAAVRGDNGTSTSTASTPVSISPGAVTVAVPR
ncbi:MAG: hypothetical protein R2762_04155 [Bryobacteraceae bacterium]